MNNQEVPFTPERFLQETAIAIPVSTPTERNKLVEHARAWATVSYQGNIPINLEADLAQLEAQCRQ